MLFYLNKTYAVIDPYTGKDTARFSSELYHEYLSGFTFPYSASVVKNTRIRYFGLLPPWSLNVIYLGYFISVVTGVIMYNKKLFKI
jgi:hypothetical protein